MIKCKLGELIEVTRGMSLPGKYYSDKGELIRLTLGNFDNNGGFKHNTSKKDIYYTGEVKDEFILEKGDIITPLTEQAYGLLGSTARIPESGKYVQSGDIALIKCKEGRLDDKFCYYLISSDIVKKQLSVAAQQTKIRHTSPDKIRNCTVVIPDLDYQIKAGELLEFITKKIRINNEINTELESMAKIMYDYWFLQFDFPDENGKPYKSSGGKMVWNEELKREIPKDFSVQYILDLCDIVDCLHSKKPDMIFENETSYLLTLENITKEGYIDLTKKYYILKKDFEKWTENICIRENDFVITNAGRAGDIAKIPQGVKCAIGRNITAIRPKNINSYYLRQFLKSEYVKVQVKNNLDCGSFFMSFNVKSIKKLLILMPEGEVYRKFVSVIKPYIIEIEKNNQENYELKKMRDFLLPLLMNGQVRFN